MEILNEIRINEYFAASNSFAGFKSDFPKIFDPERIERIFILKGGPGTGKSTLMRKLARREKERGKEVDEILCSSDPKSLDGVIIGSGKKVAVLDGTAPHATDPEYPGAKEEIINLADLFDNIGLKSESERIIRLSKAKKKAYAEAYDALALAGSVFDYVYSKIKKDGIYSLAEAKVLSILDGVKIKKGTHTPKSARISSFGCGGLFKLKNECGNLKQINLLCDNFMEGCVMEILERELLKSGNVIYVCKNALTDKITDRIYTNEYLFTLGEGGGVDIDLYGLSPVSVDGYEQLKRAYNDCLKIASFYFSCSAENHFMLEDIYKSYVDFSQSDRILSYLTEQAESLAD